MIELKLNSDSREQSIDFTEQLKEVVQKENFENGALLVFCPHTTCSVIINENYDPDVMEDLLNKLSELIPQNSNFKHSEGNSDSHIKTVLNGQSILIPVELGKLILGQWQGCIFLEFDGPRNRKLLVQFLKQ